MPLYTTATFVELTITAVTVVSIARRAFSQAAPRVWNDLQTEIRNSVTFDRIRSALRTHYYRLAFTITVHLDHVTGVLPRFAVNLRHNF